MEFQRLFFALWPDADVVGALTRWARRAHALCGGRIMRPDTLHLTLAFLGNVRTDRVPDVQAILREVQWSGGSLTLDRYGRFRGPRIVWAGPSAPVPWLDVLQRGLWQALARQDFTPPEEPFRPHVSLLRRAGPGDLARLPMPEPILWVPRRCVLVASTPRETGSYYRELASCPVTGASDRQDDTD